MIASRRCRAHSPRRSRTSCCGSRCRRPANISSCSRARRSRRWWANRPRSSRNTRSCWGKTPCQKASRQMSTDSRGYWREEFSLIAILLLFFIGIVALSYHLPFDARLFPIVIGGAGILLTLGIAIEEVRRHGARDALTADSDDPAAKADWPRYATALLAAPAFGL